MIGNYYLLKPPKDWWGDDRPGYASKHCIALCSSEYAGYEFLIFYYNSDTGEFEIKDTGIILNELYLQSFGYKIMGKDDHMPAYFWFNVGYLMKKCFHEG